MLSEKYSVARKMLMPAWPCGAESRTCVILRGTSESSRGCLPESLQRSVNGFLTVDGLNRSYASRRTLNDAGQKSSCGEFHRIGPVKCPCVH